MGELHKLLARQVKKCFGDEFPQDEKWEQFVHAINKSYLNFEQDKVLSNRAFVVAEEEFNEVNKRLLKEKELKEQLKVAMEQVKKASNAKTEFLSVMSHEIRSPLNVIVGMTHILQENENLPEQRKNLEILSISSKNLMTLINDILDFNKIEEGKIELESLNFNLKEMIDDIRKANVTLAQEKGNEIQFSWENELHERVLFDRVRLGQILTNLVSNAVKFTQNGVIRIDVQLLELLPDQQTVRIAVEDNGIGISEENQSKILERFTQANSNTTRKYGGTGLGLSITKLLLELMGSQILIQSELGKGSSFYFDLTFPLGTSHEEGVEEKELYKDLSNASILIVDDLEFNILVLEQIMRSWNVQLDTARNGKEAVQKVARNAYDLVFMDIQMPVMDGKEATREIRTFNKEIPIVALTASSSNLTKSTTVEAGMSAFITKPFDPEEVYRKVKILLGRELPIGK